MASEHIHTLLLSLLSLIAVGAIPWAFVMGGRLSTIEQATREHRRRATGHSDRLDQHDSSLSKKADQLATLEAWRHQQDESGHINHEKRITTLETKVEVLEEV